MAPESQELKKKLEIAAMPRKYFIGFEGFLHMHRYYGRLFLRKKCTGTTKKI